MVLGLLIVVEHHLVVFTPDAGLLAAAEGRMGRTGAALATGSRSITLMTAIISGRTLPSKSPSTQGDAICVCCYQPNKDHR
jgi:hypothetical protein